MLEKLSKNVMLLVVPILMFMIFFIGKCSGDKTINKGTRTVYIDTAVYDTAYVPKLLSTTNTNWITNRTYENIPVVLDLTQSQIDSIVRAISPTKLIEIASSYYSKNYYSDTLRDSSYLAIIQDSIYENKIQKRNIKINTYQKTIIEQKPQKGFLYVNGLVGGNLNSFDIGLGAGFVTKKGTMFGYTYNFIDKSNYVTIGGRIRFRK